VACEPTPRICFGGAITMALSPFLGRFTHAVGMAVAAKLDPAVDCSASTGRWLQLPGWGRRQRCGATPPPPPLAAPLWADRLKTGPKMRRFSFGPLSSPWRIAAFYHHKRNRSARFSRRAFGSFGRGVGAAVPPSARQTAPQDRLQQPAAPHCRAQKGLTRVDSTAAGTGEEISHQGRDS